MSTQYEKPGKLHIGLLDNLPSETNNSLIDCSSYGYAKKIIEQRERYVRLHIQKKPWYFPKKLYEYILKKIVLMVEFEKYQPDETLMNIAVEHRNLEFIADKILPPQLPLCFYHKETNCRYRQCLEYFEKHGPI